MVGVLSSAADVILKDAEHVSTALQTWTCAVPVLVSIHVVQHALRWVGIRVPVFQVTKITLIIFKMSGQNSFYNAVRKKKKKK